MDAAIVMIVGQCLFSKFVQEAMIKTDNIYDTIRSKEDKHEHKTIILFLHIDYLFIN